MDIDSQGLTPAIAMKAAAQSDRATAPTIPGPDCLASHLGNFTPCEIDVPENQLCNSS